MQDFKKLLVWRDAHQLTLAIYHVTASFPKDELYGLASQIKRSACSIPANITEGCERETNGELGRFLYIAMGSASELEYHLLLAHDLHFIDTQRYAQLNEQLDKVKRMLNNFIQKSNLARKQRITNENPSSN
jgi:four helix bundle protein